jgi:hypothetical protein
VIRYKLRIPAISIFWKFVDADSEDEAFDKVVSELERDAPQIRWRDREAWEIQEVDDPLENIRRWGDSEKRGSYRDT